MQSLEIVVMTGLLPDCATRDATALTLGAGVHNLGGGYKSRNQGKPGNLCRENT